MLFSATQTRRVEDLARISLKREPLYVGVDDDKEKATVDGLEQVIDFAPDFIHTRGWALYKLIQTDLCWFQGYVVCPSEKRFLLLFTFLKKNRKKKLMVFFSSCMSVKYHYELLNYIDLHVMAIHVSVPLLFTLLSAETAAVNCFSLIRESKSRPKEPPPSSSSATPTRAFCCAPT